MLFNKPQKAEEALKQPAAEIHRKMLKSEVQEEKLTVEKAEIKFNLAKNTFTA